MQITILSDLHLGAGDQLEDFLLWGPAEDGPGPEERPAAIAALGARFAALLALRLATARAAGAAPVLLLLGDIVDLWQARRHREPVARALRRILAAHPLVFGALADWRAAGGALVWVLGNHDQPLVDPRAWGELTAALPGLNAHAGGAPVHHYADPECGLYAEHGHQWDPFNRLRSLANPRASCAGRRVVEYLLNPLEPLFPLLDKGGDVPEILHLLWDLAAGESPVAWAEVARHMARLVGRGPGPARQLVSEIERALAEDRRPDFTAPHQRCDRLQQDRLRRALRPGGGTIAPPPSPLEFLATGHTHRATCCPLAGGIVHLNAGTWRPRLVRDAAGTRRLVQTLNYATIEPGPRGWEGTVAEG